MLQSKRGVFSVLAGTLRVRDGNDDDVEREKTGDAAVDFTESPRLGIPNVRALEVELRRPHLAP
jgi:hypothetical protein